MSATISHKLPGIPEIAADQMTPAVAMLLEFWHKQQEQIQALRDELARLKGQRSPNRSSSHRRLKVIERANPKRGLRNRVQSPARQPGSRFTNRSMCLHKVVFPRTVDSRAIRIL